MNHVRTSKIVIPKVRGMEVAKPRVSPDAVGEDGLLEHERGIITASKIQLPGGHLSPTAIGHYLKCPEQYHRRYVLGKKEPTTAVMAEGACMHAALAANNLHKRTNGVDMKLDEVFAIFSQRWREKMPEIEDWGDERQDVVLLRGRMLLKHYMAGFALSLKPERIEEKVTARIGPLEIVGILDVAGSVNGRHAVLDYKVAAKAKSDAELNSSLQLSCYGWAESRLGFDDFDVGFVNMLKANGRVHAQRIKYDPRRAVWFRSVALSVANAVSLGSFPLTAPDSWECSPRFCGYWGDCRGKVCA